MHYDIFEPGTSYKEGDTVRVMLYDGDTRLVCKVQMIRQRLRVVEPSDAQAQYGHKAFSKAGFCSEHRPYLRPVTDEKLRVIEFVNNLGYEKWGHLAGRCSSLEAVRNEVQEIIANHRRGAAAARSDHKRYLGDAVKADALAARLEADADLLELAARKALEAMKGPVCQQNDE